MLVVADTTPINYLILIEQVGILRSLYGQVVLPRAAATELSHPRAPEIVRTWIGSPPSWCTIRQTGGQPWCTCIRLTLARFLKQKRQ